MTTCAIIVTYQPGPKIVQSLQAVAAQVDRMHIVDNASPPETVALLKDFAAGQGERVVLTCNSDNIGLAAAQNQGIRQALADKFSWVLLLDDDSTPAPDMMEKLMAEAKRDKTLSILAPRIIDTNVDETLRHLTMHGLGYRRKTVRAGEVMGDALFVIASGSFIRADTFRAIGLMREGLFIDYIDYDFCLRAQLKKLHIAVVGDAVLQHTVGNKTRYSGLVITSNHNAVRRYYIFRNRFFILRLYGRKFPGLAIYEWLATIWDLLRILLLESEKSAKINAAMLGLWRGVTHDIPSVGIH